jgi:hypothetical protein
MLMLHEVDATDSCIMKDWHSGIKHPSAKTFQLIFKRLNFSDTLFSHGRSGTMHLRI